MNNKNNNGFTLIELIVVIAILGILVVIAAPKLSGVLGKAKINADKSTLRTLNNVTTMYKVESGIFDEDIFADLSGNENRILRLVDNGYLLKDVLPQQKDGSFQWNIDEQIWQIYIGYSPIQLSPLGNNFEEISTGMISLIKQKKITTGFYGRDWGDFRYTDLDLDPADWEEPILNMIYKPSGAKLLITPEEGYNFKIKNIEGEVKTVFDTWNLIFDIEGGKWYWHSIKPENEVDINTLTISMKS